jgi:hypothetical protein
MVSCQEPSTLKGSKHSLQCHPHGAALVNAHSFVSMGVEAMCHPCPSAARCRHMNRRPSLCHYYPCHGCCHCNHCCHLCCRCHLNHHCHHPSPVARCHRRCRWPLPLQLPSTIAAAVSVALLSVIAVAVGLALAIGHCHLHHHWPLQLPSLLAITVAVAVGHFRELLPWHSKNCIQTI